VRARNTDFARLPYATAKAALIGVTAQLARDHAADGITVNAVALGPVMGTTAA